MNSTDFEWWPLGGLGEVGMNCMVFRFGSFVLPVDAGILFADANDFGIEVLYPDYRDLLRTHQPKKWLITHGHEDHIGAVTAVFLQCEELGIEAPEFYAPPFAAELIKEKLLDSQRITNGSRYFDKIKILPTNCTFEWDALKVHYIETRHSTPDTCSLGFEWMPPGASKPFKIVHTSDFKVDTHEFEDGIKTAEIYDIFGGQQADLLFIDSTNSERSGTSVSELEIIPQLEKIIQNAKGRVYVTLFSSNVYRIAQIMKLAEQHGRFVSLAGRGLQSAFEKAENLGIVGRSAPGVNGVKRLDLSDINEHPPETQLIICSGSQGENRSTLFRLAQGNHSDLKVEKGDAVIFSSMTIPGNEKGVSRIVNGLIKQGASVFLGNQGTEPIHASGHARSDEITAVAKVLRPRFVVPVHGERRQLQACLKIISQTGKDWGFSEECGLIAENGERLQFSWQSQSAQWVFLKKVTLQEPIARMLRFENFSVSSTDAFLKYRKKAALGGIVSVWIDESAHVGVQVKGVLPLAAEGSQRVVDEDEIKKWLLSQYPNLIKQKAFEATNVELENQLADELSRVVRRQCGVRPLVMLHLIGKSR